MARLASVLLVVWLLLGLAADAHAQRARVAGPPRFDITLGAGLVTGVALGEASANLRSNATTPQSYPLFSTSTRLLPAPVVDVRVAGAVTSRVAIEGQVHFGQPELETAISADKELAPDVTVSERVTETLLAGGVRVTLANLGRQPRTLPYVSGGVGVLRQAHEEGGGTEQSSLVYLGGGVRHALSVRPGGLPRVGIRGDVQLLMVKGGLSVDDKITPQLSVTGGVFFTF
ncbi:MAG: hypothetical protein ABL986_02065 [Vicinamibacterales bacterium]